MGNVCGCESKQRGKQAVTNKATRGLQKTFTVNNRPDAELLNVFHEKDSDHDGKISAREFRECLRSFNVELSPTEIGTLFLRADKNKEKLLNEKEYLAAVQDCPDLQQLRATFELYDTDKNGRISRDEFRALAQSIMTPEECTEHKISELFTTMDADGNGFIDFREFSVVLRTPPADADEIFDAIDVNKNGFIERDEMKQAFQAVAMDISEQELDKIFKAADTNRDNKISRGEFRNKFLEMERKFAGQPTVTKEKPQTSQDLKPKEPDPKFQNKPLDTKLLEPPKLVYGPKKV